MKNVQKIITWINFIAGALGVITKVIQEIVDILPEKEEKNETESK